MFILTSELTSSILVTTSIQELGITHHTSMRIYHRGRFINLLKSCIFIVYVPYLDLMKTVHVIFILLSYV